MKQFILRHLVFSYGYRSTLSGARYGCDTAKLFGVPIPNRFGESLARLLICGLERK